MVGDIYQDGRYAVKFPAWHAEDSSWKAGHLCSLFGSNAEICLGHPPKTLGLAEVGCGAGGVISAVARRIERLSYKCSMTGYEISDYARHLASSSHPEISLMSDFMSDDSEFDLGLMVDFFEHVENPQAYLIEASRRFTWTLFHIPLDINLLGRIEKGAKYYQYLKRDRGHINYYTKSSALALLARSGHRVIRWKYTPWGLELPQPKGKRAAPIRIARSLGMRVIPNTSVYLLGGASLAVLTRGQR